MSSTTASYPTRQLGRNGPQVSAIGFGAMGIGAFYGTTDDEQSYQTLTYAADRGITFWDTANIYGHSEELIGNWFAKTGRRSEIFLATKFGDSEGLTSDFAVNAGDHSGDKNLGVGPNNKPSYIRQQFQKSLTKLRTNYIDLYYVHRIDPEVPIEITLETLREFVDAGKIKWIGLSEASVETLRRAKAVPGIGEKVIVAQMEYSIMEFGIMHSGFLDAARELGVGIVAYSPLSRGMLTGQYRSRKDLHEGDVRLILPRFFEENFSKNLVLVDKISAIAQKFNATPGEVALAWILAENPDMIPIPGTKTTKRLEENARAAELQLSQEDMKELKKLADEADIKGARYDTGFMEHTRGDSLPLSEWKGERQSY